jgi:hypothetical protein
MPGDYSTVLITVGSLACFGAFGWFLESPTDPSQLDEDVAPQDVLQQQRANVYMTAVVVTMFATIASVIA